MNKITKLNFGCGINIRKDYLNVDIKIAPEVDVSFDFSVFPYPFKDNTFKEIYADNILEHLQDIPRVMKELHRISKNKGLIRIIVPYYNCYGSYNDVTHFHHFNEYSFIPFYKNNTIANYFIKEKFELVKLSLIPTRFSKFFILSSLRKPLSKVLGQIIQKIDITLRVIK